MWKVRFCSSIFIPSVSSHITQKLCGIHKQSAFQTTNVLSGIFLFSVIATSQLWSMSYASKYTLQSLQYAILCVLTHLTQKISGCIRTFCILNNWSANEDVNFWVRDVCQMWWMSFGSKHALQSLSDASLCVLPLITWELLVVCGHCVYQNCATVTELPCVV